MQESFSLEGWKATVRNRGNAPLRDAAIHAMAKFIGTLRFDLPRDEEWPTRKAFGIVSFYKKGFRVQRNLHGYNVILAYGPMMPAHAARLSDAVETVFNRYRIEPDRARWNFGQARAQADVETEPRIFKALRDLETLLLERHVLPPAEHIPAIRNYFLRLAPVQVKRKNLEDRINALESAAMERIDELVAADQSTAAVIDRLTLRWDELKHKMESLELALDEIKKKP